MGFHDRPIICKASTISEKHINELALRIINLIEAFEKEKDYEFQPFEIDDMFLGMVKRNHERYLRHYFKQQSKK